MINHFTPPVRTLIVAFAFLNALPAAEVTIKGSSTCSPSVEAAAKAFQASHSEVKFTISQGGSAKGIEAIGQGQVTLGMASRPLKEAEKTSYPDVQAIPFGYETLVLIAHQGCGVQGLSSAQVSGIYTGSIASWKELGGLDEPLVPASLHEGHATTDAFREHFKLTVTVVGEGAAKGLTFASQGATSPTLKRLNTNQEVVAHVVGRKGGIAYLGLGPAKAAVAKGLPVHILALDGQIPSAASVTDGTYPISRPLFILQGPKTIKEAQDFVTFLTGPDGQRSLADQGAIPLSGK